MIEDDGGVIHKCDLLCLTSARDNNIFINDDEVATHKIRGHCCSRPRRSICDECFDRNDPKNKAFSLCNVGAETKCAGSP